MYLFLRCFLLAVLSVTIPFCPLWPVMGSSLMFPTNVVVDTTEPEREGRVRVREREELGTERGES